MYRAGRLDNTDLVFAHAGETHALAGAVKQRVHVPARHPPDGQVLFLRCDPVRCVDFREWLAFAHWVERSPDQELLDVAVGARLDDCHVPLVEGDAAYRLYPGLQHASHPFGLAPT